MNIPIKNVALDYFPEFKCLADKCNYTCCYQWRIDINRPDYMKVKNLRVNKEMKEKIATSFKRVKNHPRGHYAQIMLKKDGYCPFFDESRMCGLQKECGYNILPDVCKYFPRNANVSPVQRESFCSTGCEQVVNLLLARPQGLKLIEIESKGKPYMDQEYAAKKFAARPSLEFYKEIQMLFMGILQNRKYSLSHRMLLLGLAAQDLNKVTTKEQTILFIQKGLSLLEHNPEMEMQLNNLKKNISGGVLSVFKQMITHSIHKDEEIRDEYFDNMMASIYENLDIDLNKKDDLSQMELVIDMQRYNLAKKHFDEIPQTSYLMENIMVNLMIYSQFPLNWLDDKTKVWDRYLDFIIQYNIFSVLCVGYMADKADVQDLVQSIAICSRTLTHSTDFRKQLVKQWQEDKLDTLAYIAYLVG